jgi:hypothetical protein
MSDNSPFYLKNSKGEYIPIEFKDIAAKEWSNKLVLVRVGSDEHPAPESEIDQTFKGLKGADALRKLENCSFLITAHTLDFEVMEELKELGEKYVAVRVAVDDDLSKLGSLQKQAKEQLRGKTKGVVFLPTPLTVSDYKEVMEVKQRCDTRRSRRGR